LRFKSLIIFLFFCTALFNARAFDGNIRAVNNAAYFDCAVREIIEVGDVDAGDIFLFALPRKTNAMRRDLTLLPGLFFLLFIKIAEKVVIYPNKKSSKIALHY